MRKIDEKAVICVVLLLLPMIFPEFCASQESPYPIVLIHGWNSNSKTWEESEITKLFRDQFLWGDFQRLDVCLNADADPTRARHDLDIEYIYEGGPIFWRNYYLINFDVTPGSRWDNPNPFDNTFLSNESAITKQGKALGRCIKAIVDRTSKDKVILVGHSMGGLAARDYLQNSLNWIDGSHHVAKLVTIGTPHLGSNAIDIQPDFLLFFDPHSEAIRDLRYHYGSGSFPPSSTTDTAVYLFGGDELEPFPDGGFYNYDFNGDGHEGGDFVGLNQNYKLRLPSDIEYVWLTGRHGFFGYGSDGAVRLDRQALSDFGTTKVFSKQVYHSQAILDKVWYLFTSFPHEIELGQHSEIMESLDEPSNFTSAWSLKAPGVFSGFSTPPLSGELLDTDTYRLHINQGGRVEITINGLTPTENDISAIVKLYDRGSTTNVIASANNASRQAQIFLARDDLLAGDYFLQIINQFTESNWRNPHQINIGLVGAPTQIALFSSASSIPANNSATTNLRAELQDAQGSPVPSASNPVTFTITSGAASAILVGANPVNAVNGVATITLTATTTPGLVTIEASSPGLAAATTAVSVYSSPTLISGDINSNTTWTLANSPYQVTTDITVATAATLTIEPGVVVLFNSGCDLTVNGRVVANGTSNQHITFTSSATNPVPKSWGGIGLNAPPQGALRSSFTYCDFSYGGQGGYGTRGDVFEVHVYAEPQVSYCTVTNSSRNGIEILGGQYNSDFRLSITGVPLMLLSDLTVEQSARMTIDAGVHLKLSEGSDLYVNGALAAQGTPSNRIIFTSLGDDAVDGDTGGDGSTSGRMGDWGGIYFNETIDDAQSKFLYCDVKFAGGGGYGNLDVPIRMDARANPTFLSLRFTNCRYHGIDIETEDYYTNISFNQTAVPYVIRGDIGVHQGAVLTIMPGTLFKFTGGSDIRIYGGLVAESTAGNPIRFTSIRDDSRGGDSGNDGQTAGSAGDWGGIFFGETARACRISSCELYYGGGGGYGNLDRPALLDLRAEVTFSNLTIANCTSNGIALNTVGYDSDVRLRYPGRTPYLQFGDISIASGAELTIEPGCILKLSGGSDIYVNGGLKAEGTANAPIIFTSMADDSLLGDSNNDGNSLGLPGQWGGISFSGSATSALCSMRHCKFRFGGGGGYGNVGWVVQVSPLVNPTFENLRFVKNNANGIRLDDGSYNTAVTFDQTAAPYILSGDYRIEAAGGLSLAPGTLFKCYGGSDIYVNSRLTAVGTEGTPIIFTSIRDDARGGDTNNDGTSSGVAGEWGGIVFQSQSVSGASEIAYCEFWYGAGAGYGNSDAALRFESTSQKVHHVKIRQMRWHGVRTEGTASPDLGGGAYLSPGYNSFLDFSNDADRYAVINNGTATIFAKNNTWDGSTTTAIGLDIYDKTDNASKGEVIFQPFIPAGDSEAPQVAVIFPNGGETLLLGSSTTLRWYVRDNVGMTQIDVALTRDGGQVFQPLMSLNTQHDEYSWRVTGSPSSRCLLKVIGRDAAGNERFDVSDNFFAIVDSASGINYPPSTPLPLTPVAGEEMHGSDVLVWQASVDPNPFDAIRYRLEIDNDANFSSPALVEDNIDSSKVTAPLGKSATPEILAGRTVMAFRLDRLASFANLLDDAVYYWRLRAYDAKNAASAFSDGAAHFFMNKINTPPQAVSAGFSPANDIEVRSARPTISWQAALDPDLSDTPDVLYYRIQLDSDGEFVLNAAIDAQTSLGITFFVPNANLLENVRWFHRVQAIDDEGATSPWSAMQSFWVNAIDEPPQFFSIVAPADDFIATSDTVVFQWQATADPDPFDSLRYVVEWSLDRQFSNVQRLIFSSSTTQADFIRPNAAPEIFWRLKAVDSDSLVTFASDSDQQPRHLRWQTTGISPGEAIPSVYSLSQNYPNPFNPETTIQFALPKPEHVRLRIFNVAGQQVRLLISSQMQPGFHSVNWDGRDNNGRLVGSGIYFYRIEARGFSAGKKMVVVW